ncbi:squalene synthase HpnC [Amycolatopsis rhabdoformis]|uniref:Squalene synthase HpnC n=1 Tax=Amycolatopsis rhabdoformis TaxID=1448059 RepID=A0ABZ1ID65_9PSEU|nr:squalene synthase HpnC [Amycolatopsis rhabdoformis]WSE31676.1 squalene synthase HpnC [Amycolatopsis rhabdoformis]
MRSTSPGGHAADTDGLREKRHAENFPVALRVLPRRLRSDLQAVYGVARTIDDLGDEADGDRIALLKNFGDELSAAFDGAEPADPAIRGLVPAMRAGRVELEPFRRLIEANLQDQHVKRYATYEDLRGYCRLSADPVGRIVLRLFDVADPEAEELSDSVCTALQLLEHWQDVAEDYGAGRIYLPAEDLEAYGVSEDELGAAQASRRLRALMRFEIDRAAALLGSGAALVGHLRGWGRLAVSGFVAGGLATVDALRETHGDVLATQARPGKAGVLAWLVWLQVGDAKTGRRSG